MPVAVRSASRVEQRQHAKETTQDGVGWDRLRQRTRREHKHHPQPIQTRACRNKVLVCMKPPAKERGRSSFLGDKDTTRGSRQHDATLQQDIVEDRRHTTRDVRTLVGSPHRPEESLLQYLSTQGIRNGYRHPMLYRTIQYSIAIHADHYTTLHLSSYVTKSKNQEERTGQDRHFLHTLPPLVRLRICRWPLAPACPRSRSRSPLPSPPPPRCPLLSPSPSLPACPCSCPCSCPCPAELWFQASPPSWLRPSGRAFATV